MNFQDALAEYGLTEKEFEDCIIDIQNKINGENDMSWDDIVDCYGLPINSSTLRKACSNKPFGSKFVLDYFNNKTPNYDSKLELLKRERKKIQTLNLERNRIDFEESRRALYFEYIKDAIVTLPSPEFLPVYSGRKADKDYLLCIADIHYGAKFKSINNEYSPEICGIRFGKLLSETITFIQDKQLKSIKIASLGDNIQGLLRISDIKLNDSSVVKAVVNISRLIALFLNELSRYVYIDYYHVPTSNHSQNRNLGTKASELPLEDMEYIIGNYIYDLLANNERVTVNLAKEQNEYIKIPVYKFNIIAMHGHQIRELEDSIKKMSLLNREFIDTLIIGHQHSSKELIGFESAHSDAEILVCPSFIGSDGYSDKLMVGAKPAVKIFGFDPEHCHTETYKIIL